jgi:nitroreductase
MSAKPVHNETIIRQLQWRYATKKFDPTRKISAEDWATLEHAIILAPSSFGLQPWKALVVNDPAIRQKLLPASFGQQQVVDASHLVVFACLKAIGPAHVQHLIDRIAEVRGVPASGLDGFKQHMLGFVNGTPDAHKESWAARQAYIALGVLLSAAAMLGIDACPMEGLEPAKFNEILGLTHHGYSAVAMCTLGYRSPEDGHAAAAKVRHPASHIIQHV